MIEVLDGQVTLQDLGICCGKTSPEHSAVTKAKTSGRSSKRSQKSNRKTPIFLDMRGVGHTQDVSWETDGALLGDYTMHSFGESPREENVSRLSQILEANPPRRYCLSAKACAGILRRAEKRGKELPPMLKEALERQSVSKSEPENQGGGKGILIQDERIGALSTLNNQSVCCPNDQGGSQMGVTEDVTGTLRAQEHGHQPVVFGISSYDSNAMKSSNPHSGVYEAETARTIDNNGGSPACNQGGMAVVQASGVVSKGNGDCFVTPEKHMSLSVGGGQAGQGYPCVCIEGNGSRPSHKGDGYAESETMYTLNSTEHHSVAYRKTSHAKSAEDGQGWAETEVNDTLNAFDSGESRTPTVVVAPHITPKIDTNGVAFTLNERDYKDAQAVCIENHPQDSRVKISEDGVVQTLSKQMGTGGGNVPMVCIDMDNERRSGAKISYNLAPTLSARAGTGGNNVPAIGEATVRRLTPLECERLQGFPCGWTDIGEWTDSKGKMRKCSDSARYKALGNSIAIPFWFYILRRMAAQYERPATLGSLFDGIGGFPLCWERCNGKGTAIWASEIEEFPIAVTKKRFGDS